MADPVIEHEEQPAIFPRERVPIPRPLKDLVWDEKPKTIKELIATSRLPFVAKIYSGDLQKFVPRWTNKPEEEENESDVLQVMEIRRKKMVVIRKMQWDRKSGDYVAGGKQADIPATFKGWFEVLPEDGRPVEYFDSIQAIMNVKPRRFLVRTLTVGYQLTVDNGTSSWAAYELRPGTVLVTGIVFLDQKKSKSNVKTFFKKILKVNRHTKKEQDLKYLQCFDTSGKEIMIPLIMSGVFSPIGETAEENFDSVYELQDLILAFNLPVKAQLIHEEDQQRTHIVPHGIVQVEAVKDHELIAFGKYPVCSHDDELFEIPMDAEIMLKKDVSKKRRNRMKSQPSIVPDIASKEHHLYMNTGCTEIELPIKVKEPRKTKAGILEKLSVRSKSKKERASLKALQEEGVFSSRLSKSDVNFEELCRIDDPSDDEDTSEKNKETAENAVRDKGDMPQSRPLDTLSLQSSDKNSNYPYGVFTNPNLLQSRDLPPIPPNENKDQSSRTEKEGVYEELPVAPKPPQRASNSDNAHTHNEDDDGYMSPAQLKLKSQQTLRGQVTRVVVRNKPPVAPSREYAKHSRMRKARSEIPSNFDDYREFDSNNELDIDELFRFQSENDSGYQTHSSYASKSSSGYHTTVNAQINQRQNSLPFDDVSTFSDDSRLETRSNSGWQRYKSRSHRSLNVDANATVRSHNVRKVRNAMDVFNFSDSLQDLKRSNTNIDQDVDFQNRQEQRFDGTNTPMDNERTQYTKNFSRTPNYTESEPGYKRYTRSASVSGLSDNFSKHYEDSAVSGDYGYHGDSEYSYNEYSEYRDDNWSPPDDLSHLTVQEVSKSLHYIGMKDRVVIRLANEQIDGELLCSLDKQLLQEGFPELNALDIKKITDFIRGWRPKKK